MLQQTRVAAALDYYRRFLETFPTLESLAAAPDQDLLTAWAGLGYYSRARNLQKAARQIAHHGEFPSDYAAIRDLPGIGDYTAAAVGSIAFGLPYAAVDGNVVRVLSRVSAEPGEVTAGPVKARLAAMARDLLSPTRPGDFNQAMMELGATICLPNQAPQCLLCPVAEHCQARAEGRQLQFPVKRAKAPNTEANHRILYIEDAGGVLLWQRPPESRRLAGFWEFPLAEQLPEAKILRIFGEFRHSIVSTNYRFEVAEASVSVEPAGFVRRPKDRLSEIPLSTTTKKAIRCLRQ